MDAIFSGNKTPTGLPTVRWVFSLPERARTDVPFESLLHRFLDYRHEVLPSPIVARLDRPVYARLPTLSIAKGYAHPTACRSTSSVSAKSNERRPWASNFPPATRRPSRSLRR